jgi:class 3 adenylate cyclase
MPDRILDEPSDRTDWRAAPREWDDNHVGPGTDPPVAVAALQAPHQVIRTFAFLDLCGFTSYTDAHGPVAAYDLLVQFRALVREIAAKRGVRVAKWIGDGVLLVGIGGRGKSTTALACAPSFLRSDSTTTSSTLLPAAYCFSPHTSFMI